VSKTKDNRNPKNEIENIVKDLRQLRSRQGREKTKTCYIEGNRIVAQAVQAEVQVERVVIAPDIITNQQVWDTVSALENAGVPVLKLSTKSFDSISFKSNPHGIGMVIKPRLHELKDIQPDLLDFAWVALDKVGNPGNLGAIFRTCDAVGVKGVILLDDTVDPYHPDAVKASMGAIFSLSIVRCTFPEFVEWKNDMGYQVVGTSGEAEESYRSLNYPNPFILMMGSERLGLSEEKQKVCDQIVRIPMVGKSDSLNLAVAASLILYEAFHKVRN